MGSFGDFYLEIVDEGQGGTEHSGLQEPSAFKTGCCRLEVTQLQVGLRLAHIQLSLKHPTAGVISYHNKQKDLKICKG